MIGSRSHRDRAVKYVPLRAFRDRPTCLAWQVLSRAFRNRFLEMHMEDIPDAELQTILEKRCAAYPLTR